MFTKPLDCNQIEVQMVPAVPYHFFCYENTLMIQIEELGNMSFPEGLNIRLTATSLFNETNTTDLWLQPGVHLSFSLSLLIKNLLNVSFL